VPPQSALESFNVGYLQKRSQTKQWIVNKQDFESMYAQSGGGIFPSGVTIE